VPSKPGLFVERLAAGCCAALGLAECGYERRGGVSNKGLCTSCVACGTSDELDTSSSSAPGLHGEAEGGPLPRGASLLQKERAAA